MSRSIPAEDMAVNQVAPSHEARPTPSLTFTVLTSFTCEMTKTINVDEEGNFHKSANTNPYAGTLEVRELPVDLNALAAVSEQYTPWQCGVIGTMISGVKSAPLTTTERFDPNDPLGAIPRAKVAFWFEPTKYVPVPIDHDGSMTVEELDDLLRSLDRDFADVGALYRLSPSSCIRSIDGKADSGRRGIHAYLMILGSSVADFKEWLRVKLAAAGHVWAIVSDNGVPLLRYPVDMAPLNDVTRCMYEAPAILGPGLEAYGRGERIITGNPTKPIDFSALTPLTQQDRDAAKRNEDAALAAVAEQAKAQKEVWCLARGKKLREKNPKLTEEEAVRQARRVLEVGDLPPDFEVALIVKGRHVAVTVREILANKKLYQHAVGPDPVESDYQEEKVCAIVYTDGRPCIYSQAHGGRVLRLLDDRAHLITREGALAMFCENAMQAAAKSGRFFNQGGRIVTPCNGALVPLNRLSLSHELDSVVAVQKVTKVKGGGFKEGPTDFPQPATDRIVNTPRLVETLPPVEGIRRDPLLLPDGRLLAGFGYDADTGLVLEISDACDDIAEVPTAEDVRRAVADLTAPYAAYKYSSDRDRSAAVLMLLTAAQRTAVPLAPGFDIEAPEKGSGKTRKAQVAGVVAGGYDLIDTSTRSEELGKRVDAFTVNPRGRGCLIVDNINDSSAFSGSELSTLLTSERKAVRIYGRNDLVVDVSTRFTVIATANNGRRTGDAVRRWVTVRVEPAGASPHLAKFAFTPEAVATATRPKMMRAAITLLRAGLGLAVGLELGSFEAWSRFFGAALDAAVDAGVPGLVPFASVIADDSTADPQHAALQAFADALKACCHAKDDRGIVWDLDGDGRLAITYDELRSRLVDGFGRRNVSLSPVNAALGTALDDLCAAAGRRVWTQTGTWHPPLLGQLVSSLVGVLFPRKKGGQTWTVAVAGDARARSLVLRPVA